VNDRLDRWAAWTARNAEVVANILLVLLAIAVLCLAYLDATLR